MTDYDNNLRRLGGCKPKPAAERFAASYRQDEASGCWLWLGVKRGSNGYGAIKVNRLPVPAHRYSWQIHNGEIPQGMLVCHTCDTPLCVNPLHLFLGTHQMNSDDKRAKGREPRGESSHRAVLKETAVLQIRMDKRAQSVIAADHGITQAAVSLIKLRKTWGHING